MSAFRFIAVLCMFGLAPFAAQADVHKCVNAKGQVEYRDVPCGTNGKAAKVIKSPGSAPREDEPIYEEDSEDAAPDPGDVTPAPAAPAPAVLAPPGAHSY